MIRKKKHRQQIKKKNQQWFNAEKKDCQYHENISFQ
jgi:hypothetical protein